MGKKEKNFQTRVIKYLRENKYYTLNINPDGITVKAGTPDLIVCIEGIYCGLELKIGTKYKATNRQIINLKQIREAGGVGIVLIETPEGKADLDKIIGYCTNKKIGIINKMYPLPEVKG